MSIEVGDELSEELDEDKELREIPLSERQLNELIQIPPREK